MSAPRKVLLGTPCYDGRPEAWYMHSVIETIKACAARNIEVTPIMMCYDAMIQRARNDLLKLALDHGCDDLLFVDADEVWKAEWATRLLEHDVDVVGAAVRKKTDDAELYNVRAPSPFIPIDGRTGLWRVEGIGTGFLRLSRKAMQALWDQSADMEYEDNGKINRMVFNVAVVNRRLVSEDNFMCNRLTEAGFPIWVDPAFTISHIGQKRYTGDFASWIAGLQRARTEGAK